MTEPFPRTWRQEAVIVPVVRALKLWFRPRVHGLDQVPVDQPVIYVGKHPRTFLYLEVMLLAVLSFWDSGRRPFRPMEKRGTAPHRLPGLGWIRKHVGAIEATEEAGLAALRAGESLLVFPGGARELYGPPDFIDWKGRRGYAKMAVAAGAAVVPFAIAGADQQHPWRVPLGKSGSLWLPLFPLPVPLDFHFGAPLEPPPPGDAAALATFADRVAAETSALLARGVAGRRPAWSL